MQQYKNKAIQAQIAKLNSGSSQCAKSKRSKKCKSAIKTKIAKLKSKIK